MKNVFFPDENITANDLYFVCFMVERIARLLKQPNKYVVNTMGKKEIEERLSLANVQHAENPDAVANQWITDNSLSSGNVDVTDVDADLVTKVPTDLQMGKVYSRLIQSTLKDDENLADAMLRIYNDPLCEIIDNYNSSAYFEPSYFITRAYYQGGF